MILTRRVNNGPYGTTAYSFRHQRQKLNLHRNNVDIVFNGCGQLHINPPVGLQGRVCDLGNVELAKVALADLDNVPRQSWRRFCLPPVDGHVYLHEGRYLNQRFAIAFKIKVIKPDRFDLHWRTLGQQENRRCEVSLRGGGYDGTVWWNARPTVVSMRKRFSISRVPKLVLWPVGCVTGIST